MKYLEDLSPKFDVLGLGVRLANGVVPSKDSTESSLILEGREAVTSSYDVKANYVKDTTNQLGKTVSYVNDEYG